MTEEILPIGHMQVDVPVLKVGDVVRLSDDMTEVRKLQKGHGEWVEGMAVVRTINCITM